MSERVIQILIQSFPRILLPGLLATIPLTILAFSLSLVIAVIAAMIRFARVPVLRQIVRFYVWVIRGTPLLVQLMVGYYGPSAFGIRPNGFLVAVIVFAVNEGAYCAETMRAAIESVPQGQMEAGYCVGMNYIQIMRRIVLPQAFRAIIPTLLSQIITTIKDSSFLANVAVIELMARTKQILSAANRYNGSNAIHVSDVFILFGLAAVIYFVINFSLSVTVRKIQKRREKQAVVRPGAD